MEQGCKYVNCEPPFKLQKIHIVITEQPKIRFRHTQMERSRKHAASFHLNNQYGKFPSPLMDGKHFFFQ